MGFRIEVSGFRTELIALVTTLLDENAYPDAALAELFLSPITGSYQGSACGRGAMNPLVAAALMPINSLLTLALVTAGMRRAFRL